MEVICVCVCGVGLRMEVSKLIVHPCLEGERRVFLGEVSKSSALSKKKKSCMLLISFYQYLKRMLDLTVMFIRPSE